MHVHPAKARMYQSFINYFRKVANEEITLTQVNETEIVMTAEPGAPEIFNRIVEIIGAFFRYEVSEADTLQQLKNLYTTERN